MRYLDAHAHIQFPEYDVDRDAVLARMHEAGVGAVLVGCDYASSEAAIALSADRADFFAAVGQHPNDKPDDVFDRARFMELAQHSKVVAIGECGLDFYRQEDSEEEHTRQRGLFLEHLEIAVALTKPLIIHARPTKGTQNAYQELIAILTEKKAEHGDALMGDVHFFVGGVEEARALTALGFTVSFTAVLTFTHDYDEVIRSIPLTSILAETDSPYVAPEGKRGTRNEPTAVIDVVGAIARMRGEDEEMVRETLLANAARVFGLPE